MSQTNSSPDQSLDVPSHVAMIMDGNGRWARERDKSRIRGHEEGARSVRSITTRCAEIGIEELTLYAFSMDNWKRPDKEVKFLMQLLQTYLKQELETIMQNNIRFRTIGKTENLPDMPRDLIEETEKRSRDNDGMVLRLALNYSGQKEVMDTVKKWIQKDRKEQVDLGQIDVQSFRSSMYDPEMTEPDLLIRTGGEQRISDFLLFHLSYTEFYFTETYWPDFRESHLEKAIEDFCQRKRRFGGLENH